MKLRELLKKREFIIAVPIPVRNVETVSKVKSVISKYRDVIDIVEFRLDYLEDIDDVESVTNEILRINHPKIITIREVSEGGFREISHQVKLKVISDLQSMESTYVDLEYNFFNRYSIDVSKYSGVIISEHYINDKPVLNELLTKLKTLDVNPYIDVYKIAVSVNNLQELKLLIDFTIEAERIKNRIYLAVMPMCNCKLWRIIFPILRSKIMYCSLIETTAKGQLNLNECLAFREFIKNLQA